MRPATPETLRVRHLRRLTVKAVFVTYLAVIWLGLAYFFVIAVRHA